MNYSEAYAHGTQILSAAGISEAALDSRLLLEYITGHDRQKLLTEPAEELSGREAAEYDRLLDQRASRIPLQLITGSCNFMGIDFTVSDKVLIPRQDSECLVEEAMRYTGDGADILDLCTGSGCLLLSLMHYKNNCRGTGTDISPDALSVARINQRMLEDTGGLNGGTVSFLEGDLYDALDAGSRFDVIISNPPYIRSADIETLMPEVRDHEPRLALDGGEDGLIFYRRIAKGAGEYLARYGRLFFEIGYDQAADVTRILQDAGYTDISVIKDYGGNDRVITAVNAG